METQQRKRRLLQLTISTVVGLMMVLGVVSALTAGASPLLAMETEDGPQRAAGHAGDTPAPLSAASCWATIDGTTVYSSTDASALQDAVDLAGSGDTVKVAGTCAGVEFTGGHTQTLYIATSGITVQGGYTHTNWLADPDPETYPTVLDAQNTGRVVLTPPSTQVSDVTLAGLYITNGNTVDAAAGSCWHSHPGAGGGLCLSKVSNVTVRNSFIYNNVATRGGGLHHHTGSDVLLIDTTVVSNETTLAGGGIATIYGDVELQNCTVSGNTSNGNGGGIYLHDNLLTVSNSTISSNSGSRGGGLYLEGSGATATFINTTVISNTAIYDGGGIYRQHAATTITNTIVAYNSDVDSSSPDCYGTITSGDYNLIQDSTGCTLTGTLTHVITGTDPLLEPLADNGGETETPALPQSSPAVDWIPAGTNGCGTTVAEDQRGVMRPQADGCDIGAYEVEAPCHAEISGDDVTDFSSWDASAVQDAIDALDPTSDTVKIAGTCAGVQLHGGTTVQTVYVDRNVMLRGGYTYTNWLADPDPDAYPTTLDAEDSGRVVYVPAGYTVAIEGLTLTRGDGNNGAGVYNAGSNLTLDAVEILNSTASADGGGLYNVASGSVTITASTIATNTATGIGGGACNWGTLSVTDSLFQGNQSEDGGGLVNFGTLDLATSELVNNTGTGLSGGIVNTGPATLTQSAITGNQSQFGGGIFNDDELSVVDCAIAENISTQEAGGIYNEEGGSLTITGSTIAGNQAGTYGAGIVNWGERLTLINSTISGNAAQTWGGGLYQNDPENYVPEIHLLHTTIVSNSAASGGDGLYLTVGTATFTGTVVADNGTQNCAGSGVYTYTSGGYNLEDADTCGFAASADITGTNPLLDGLADNGGPTETHLPLSGSPLLDVIPESSCAVSTDQRGEPRPSDGACDVGAVELWVDDPPVAADETYATSEDVPLTIAAPGVLANDHDPEGASLAAYLRDGPANGAVTLARDGGFVYTPTQDFNGSDSFSYLASDAGPEAAAYWPFDEGSGTTAYDESGNGHDATLTGGPTFTTTVPTTPTFSNSTALHFDGVDDVVAIPNSDDINLGAHERRTVSAWFNVDDDTTNSRKQVIWEEGGMGNGLNLYVYDGGLYAGAWNASSGWDGLWLGPVDVSAGRWHHAALVLDGSTTPGTLELYLDGELAASGDGYALDEHANDIGIGQVQGDTQFHDGNVSGGGHAFGGLIDDVRVYNQAFAADWVAEAMEKTTPGLNTAATVTITVSAVADAPRAAADVYTTTVNTPLVVDYSSITVTATSSPSSTIPDGAYDGSWGTMACDTLNTGDLVESGWVVQELSVTLSITHTWVGDLVVKLVSPEGSVLGLVSRPGTTEIADDGGNDTTWASGATLQANFPIHIYDGAPYDAEEMGAGLGWGSVICRDDGECDFYPNPGAVAGLSDLAGFAGEQATGDWQLCVGDTVAGGEGTLAAWSLEMVAMEPGVLFNDVEPDGESLTATLRTPPTNGDVSLASDGTFVYTPTADFTGADAFTYVASDGVLTDTAVVTVTVPDPGPPTGTCFAEIHGGNVTDFSSDDASAVQAAMDAVADGGTVKLGGTCAGVEARAGLTQTVFISRDVTLQGGYTYTNWLADPDPTVYTTTLDAGRLGRVAYVSGTLGVTLDGLSVTGGDGAQSGGTLSSTGNKRGGGIYVESGSTLTVANSVVYSNTITVMADGGALALDGTASAVVTNTTFADNAASNGKGGAISVWEGALDIYTSHFAENTASISGGAIYLFHNPSPLRITDSSLEGNAACSGGGVYLTDGAAEIHGGVFTGNHSGTGPGGAINVSGALLVEDSTFEGNWSDDSAGAIYLINSNEPVTLTNTIFRDNWSPSFSVAGALSLSGPTTIISSTFEGNSSGRGGAIRSADDLTITGSLFQENAVTGSSGIGGAIYHFTSSDLSVSDSAFISNTALNAGGAIHQGSDSMLTLTSSTFVSNSASYGGALYLHPASYYATLENVTLSANTAITSGGGIYNYSLLALNHVTLAWNTVISPSGGGGLYNAGTFNTYHTLIAGSGAGKDCVNDHILGVNEYNLVEDGTCSPHLSGDPFLTPLADNGGATLTHLPYGFSPIVDAIPAAECSLATDQRGEPRPANSGCDIGAVEFDYGVPGVELGPDSVIEAAPGDCVTHTFVLTHTGDVTDIFDLALSGPTWPTAVSATDTGLLDPGEPFTVSVVVTVPDDPRATRAIIGSDVFTLTATSQVDGATSATATGTTQATAVPGVALDGDQSGSGRVGEAVTYTVGVTNNGSFTDTIDLSPSGNTWPVTLSAAALVLGGGDVDTVVITVTVPTTATLGSGDTVTLTATSQLDSLVGDSAAFTTTLEPFDIHLPFVTKK
jgi:predicted outer membrane repeat protein